MLTIPQFVPRAHEVQSWQVTKPAARGTRGIVVSQSATAAAVGIAMLEAGGNAVDAAVATAFALGAVEPWNSGLGGIGFALVQPAGARRAELVDFGPVAPADLDASRFRLTGRATADGFGLPEVEQDRNLHGALSCVVPAAVEGYRAMHARWGSLPMSELVQPALELARRGLPADWFTTLMVAQSAASLRRYPETARIYLRDGLPPAPPYQGDPAYLPLGRLADTLERLQHAGLRDFYHGDIAASLVADMQAEGGVLSRADLQACAAPVGPADATPWRNGVLHHAGGRTAGTLLARVLGDLPPAAPGVPDAGWYAALARAMRAAYHDRLAAESVAAMVGEGCTTHLTVCDAQGGVVALTTTLLSSMGSKLVLPGSGVLMNNGVMWFDPRPGLANSIAPGRRPLTNMCPVILLDGERRPVLAGGASGGRRIMGAVLQLLAFVAAFDMDPQQAAHHPRIDVSGPDLILADPRLPADVLAALRAVGPTRTAQHVVQPINYACPNLIQLRADGVRVGVSDALSPWSAALAEPARDGRFR